jgi:hypothetical protein
MPVVPAFISSNGDPGVLTDNVKIIHGTILAQLPAPQNQLNL